MPHPAGNVPALVGRGPTEPGIDRCESLAPDVIFDFGIASEPGIRADPQRRTAAQSKLILGTERGCVFRHVIKALSAQIDRSEEHTSELHALLRISYAVFGLKKKKRKKNTRGSYK